MNNTDQHDRDYIKLKVVTASGGWYLCNRADIGEGVVRLYGVYDSHTPIHDKNRAPTTVTVVGPCDIVAIPEGRWILPDFFNV